MDKSKKSFKLLERIRECKQSVLDAERDYVEEVARFKIGDIVKNSKNDMEYKVATRTIWCTDRIEYRGFKIKKNGEPSERLIDLYDYDYLVLVKKNEEIS